MAGDEDFTSMLAAASGGDRASADALLSRVYDELRALASGQMRFERRGHTLQTTALVHEAYLKLVDLSRVEWRGRAHFLAAASTAMRRILINHAKERRRLKRGGSAERVPLDEALASFEQRAIDLEALDEALERLAELDSQQARVVEMRFFGGMTVDEIAEVLGASPRTINREWELARAWLRGQVSRGDEP